MPHFSDHICRLPHRAYSCSALLVKPRSKSVAAAHRMVYGQSPAEKAHGKRIVLQHAATSEGVLQQQKRPMYSHPELLNVHTTLASFIFTYFERVLLVLMAPVGLFVLHSLQRGAGACAFHDRRNPGPDRHHRKLGGSLLQHKLCLHGNLHAGAVCKPVRSLASRVRRRPVGEPCRTDRFNHLPENVSAMGGSRICCL